MGWLFLNKHSGAVKFIIIIINHELYG